MVGIVHPTYKMFEQVSISCLPMGSVSNGLVSAQGSSVTLLPMS